MERSGKGLTISLTLSTKSPNKKQKVRTDITDITDQYFRKFIKEFKNSPYLGYKKKHVHYEPTEAYIFLIKHISNPIKSNKHVRLSTKIVNSGFDGTKCVNKKFDIPKKHFNL